MLHHKPDILRDLGVVGVPRDATVVLAIAADAIDNVTRALFLEAERLALEWVGRNGLAASWG